MEEVISWTTVCQIFGILEKQMGPSGWLIYIEGRFVEVLTFPCLQIIEKPLLMLMLTVN